MTGLSPEDPVPLDPAHRSGQGRYLWFAHRWLLPSLAGTRDVKCHNSAWYLVTTRSNLGGATSSSAEAPDGFGFAHVAEWHVPIDLGLLGEAQDSFADDVALDLVTTATNRVDECRHRRLIDLLGGCR